MALEVLQKMYLSKTLVLRNISVIVFIVVIIIVESLWGVLRPFEQH